MCHLWVLFKVAWYRANNGNIVPCIFSYRVIIFCAKESFAVAFDCQFFYQYCCYLLIYATFCCRLIIDFFFIVCIENSLSLHKGFKKLFYCSACFKCKAETLCLFFFFHCFVILFDYTERFIIIM